MNRDEGAGVYTEYKSSGGDRSMEVKLSPPLKALWRTNQPTDRQTDPQTDRPGHMEVSLLIRVEPDLRKEFIEARG